MYVLFAELARPLGDRSEHMKTFIPSSIVGCQPIICSQGAVPSGDDSFATLIDLINLSYSENISVIFVESMTDLPSCWIRRIASSSLENNPFLQGKCSELDPIAARCLTSGAHRGDHHFGKGLLGIPATAAPALKTWSRTTAQGRGYFHTGNMNSAVSTQLQTSTTSEMCLQVEQHRARQGRTPDPQPRNPTKKIGFDIRFLNMQIWS